MAEVWIITVNYKGADATERFLASAAGLDGISNARLLVVENGSGDGSAEKLRQAVQQYQNRFKNLELLESSVNRGYFGAARWALDSFLSRGQKADWIILCNNDITFGDRRFLAKLLECDPNRGQVIAPAILDRQTGADSNPFLRQRPSPAQLLYYRFWQLHYGLMWIQQWLSPYVRILRRCVASCLQRPSLSQRASIYAPHGAFLIFSRGYFEAGGYIDDGFFLYAEEFSIGEICRRLNLPVVYDPRLCVEHNAHRTTGRMCNRVSYAQSCEGMEYILRKYFSTPTAAESR
jgi:GT2 family glycosyltransferase